MICIKKILIVSLFCLASILAHACELDAITTKSKNQDKAVKRIYAQWYSRPLHYGLTQSKWPSVIAGAVANSRLSRFYINRFINTYSIDMTEAKNPTSYKTFNDFFTRTLKKEARPIDQNPSSITSPADGTVIVIPDLQQTTDFPIKGVTFSLEKLLEDKKLARTFQGGTAFIVRLAPWDYHRLHFPLAGTVKPHKTIHGVYESVNPFVYTCGIQPLEINERHLILYDTTECGTVALLPVGALFVGSIVETYAPEKNYSRGDELGYFSFGGSTIVMLFQRAKIIPDATIAKNSREGKETIIKMGQTVGHITNEKNHP